MRIRVFLPLLVFLFSLSSARAADIPRQWLTHAESHGFRSTSSLAETVDFLNRAAEASPFMRLEFIGESAQGRKIPLLIISRDGLFDAESARKAGATVLLIQSCIHSGEVDGKTASEMIIRDLVLGKLPEILDAGVILFLPIYNADGHERISPYNRANQNGPVDGMGFRTTAQGLDLNRDHLKLESPEARALIRLVNRWRPDLHVDNHVTDGSRHHWILTLSHAEAPQLAQPLDTWLKKHLSQIKSSLSKEGIANGPYVGLVDGADPAKGIDSSVAAPRYSTGYFTLRNRISILVEMYAYAPFEDRVKENYAFLVELLREVARAPEALHRAVAEADTAEINRGRASAEPSEVVLRWKTSEHPDRISFPVCSWTKEVSTATGHEYARYHCSDEDEPIEVPWYHRPEAEISVARPKGYLLLPGWPMIESRLIEHGLQLFRIGREVKLSVESIHVEKPRLARNSYQGQVRLEDFSTERKKETRTFPVGSLWIPANQADFEIAVQLLEPEAPDSLLQWGYLHSVFERKEYIGPAELELLVREMLKDPETAREWDEVKQKITPGEAYLWWYSRTPYWDSTIGELPYARVMSIPANLPTEKLELD